MRKKWYNTLPWIALLSGTLMVIIIAIAIVLKPEKNIENAINRKIAYDKLKQIQLDSKEAIYSKSFTDYLDKTLNDPVINTIWLVSNEGTILYADGMMAARNSVNSSIYGPIDKQSQGLLNAVDESLDTLQKEVLYIAAAIRSEGEHNDVVGHIVMPLKTGSNELAGFIGIAYELDDSEGPVQFYVIFSVALLLCFLIYWLSLPVWVYYDSRNKNEKYILWTLFVLIGNLPAFIAYLLAKK